METTTVLIIITLVMVGVNVFLQLETRRRDSKMIRDLLNRTMARDFAQYVQGEVAQAPAKEVNLSEAERAFMEAQAQGLPVA